MVDPVKKKVDDNWKASVQKKKETLTQEKDSPQKDNFPEVSFLIHISQLAMQSMVFLGLIQHPNGEKVEIDLLQSKYLIDTIEMLQNKAKDSLSEKEKNSVATILYDLRLKYLTVQKKQFPLKK